jgi:endonuclease/exonuclease/phosphatase family metal-dependent hydrolase
MLMFVCRWPLFTVCLFLFTPAGTAAGEDTSAPLRVLTYNVLHDGPWSGFIDQGTDLEERLDMTIRELKALQPDIIALQEASESRRHGHVPKRIAEALGFHVIFAPATDRVFGLRPLDRLIVTLLGFQEGSAILSRFPINTWEVYELPRCVRRWDPRIVLRVELNTPNGPITVISTHAAPGGDCQLQRIGEWLMEKQRGRPAIVMGDLNATEDSSVLVHWREHNGFVDAFRERHRDVDGATVWQQIHTPESTVSRRVDYIFLVQGSEQAMEVRDSRLVLDRPDRRPAGSFLWPSDHRGVWAEIHLHPPLLQPR